MTGDPKYAKAVNRVFDLMAHKKPPHGLFPIYVNTRDGSFTNSKVTFGALGDSFYEYLLKVKRSVEVSVQRFILRLVSHFCCFIFWP